MNLEEVIGCFLWIETGNSIPFGYSLRPKHIDFDLTFFGITQIRNHHFLRTLWWKLCEIVRLPGIKPKGHFMR